LIELHSPCEISGFAKGRTRGACFAETANLLPFKIIFGLLSPYKAVSIALTSSRGGGLKENTRRLFCRDV